MKEYENIHTGSKGELSLGDYSAEAILTDPFIERTLKLARDYNEIFQDSTPTDDEKATTIAELDYAWGPIVGSVIRYTGLVKIATSATDEDGNTILREFFLDGVSVVSQGFHIHDEKIFVGGEHIGSTSRVGHFLMISPADVPPEDDRLDMEGETNDSTHIYAGGDIDSSAIEIDYASPERALAWLTATCPDLMNEIDERILNGSGGEDRALLSLQNLNLNKYVDLSDTFTKNCLVTYLNKIIEIDTAVPYSTQLDGYILRDNDSEESFDLYKIKTSNTLIYIDGLSIQHTLSVEEEVNQWELAVHIGIISDNRTDEIDRCIASLNSFMNLQSVRHAYYQIDT